MLDGVHKGNTEWMWMDGILSNGDRLTRRNATQCEFGYRQH